MSLGNYQSVTDLLDKARADNEALRAEIARLQGRDRAAFNDLRGQTVRQVHRDDVVVITGAEWLRMRRAELAAEGDA